VNKQTQNSPYLELVVKWYSSTQHSLVVWCFR